MHGVLVNAAHPDDWSRVMQLSEEYPFCYAALGIHPLFLRGTDMSFLAELRQTLAHPAVRAVGEIGLDAWESRENLAQQREYFAAQVQLAQEYNLPVAIHNRKTWDVFFEVLRELSITRLRGYCHAFSASVEIARQVLDCGLMLSFASPAAFPGASRAHEAIRYAPMEAILTETDCPDLPGPGAENGESRPWHVAETLGIIASIKKIQTAEAEQIIDGNFDQLIQR